MRITISGSPGSGTTTLGRRIADKFGFKYVSAGEVFRALAKERNMELADFGRLAKQNPEIDKDIDASQKKIGEESDDIIIEGRLAGWMVENADLKVYLYASEKCRSERIAERENRTVEEAYNLTIEREKCEAGRYMEYYNIDIADYSPYDIVISSETFGVDELYAVIETAVNSLKK
ncbi:MAG: AAA family ATPase [Methanocorpusculum sp.]|nr:AAA family ATPase [Methanocorpusculum sp.]